MKDEYDFADAKNFNAPEDIAAILEQDARATRLKRFIMESNRIEGYRDGAWTEEQQEVLEDFLTGDVVNIAGLHAIVRSAPGVLDDIGLRDKPGMNVVISGRRGDKLVVFHEPPNGGPEVRERLQGLLKMVNELTHCVDEMAYAMHQHYEQLHPFEDGNGRSGRALWLWMMLRWDVDPGALARGFLHTWYYQSLRAWRLNER